MHCTGILAARLVSVEASPATEDSDTPVPRFLNIWVQQPSASGGGLFTHTVYTCSAQMERVSDYPWLLDPMSQ